MLHDDDAVGDHLLELELGAIGDEHLVHLAHVARPVVLGSHVRTTPETIGAKWEALVKYLVRREGGVAQAVCGPAVCGGGRVGG